MPKVNFSKVEKSFDRALQKLVINHLSELAAIANVIHDPQSNITSKTIEEIIGRFQKELKKLKKRDSKLFEKLNLSPEDESRFNRPASEFLQEDWLRLKALKMRITELKHELYRQKRIECANMTIQVDQERRRHINKRFNIRDGWLPLH